MLDGNAVAERDLFDLHRAVLTETATVKFSPAGARKRESNSVSAGAPDGRQIVIEFPRPERIPGFMNHWLDRFNRLAELREP